MKIRVKTNIKLGSGEIIHGGSVYSNVDGAFPEGLDDEELLADSRLIEILDDTPAKVVKAPIAPKAPAEPKAPAAPKVPAVGGVKRRKLS